MEIRDYVAIASLVLTILLFLYTRWAMNQDKSASAIKTVHTELKTEIDELRSAQHEDERRLTHIETIVDTMPDRETVHRLEMDLAEVKGGMRVLETEVKPIASAVQRIEKFLLDNAINRQASKK